MERFSAERETDLSEKLAARLLGHLRRHLLWDSLLLLLPLLLAFTSLANIFYHSAWAARETLILAAVAVFGLALIAGIFRRRALAPSVLAAARLIDEKIGGQERFLTLATIEPSFCPPFLLTRLRREAADLAPRVDLERDFPYQVKRSFFLSLICSLSVILLFFLFQLFSSFIAPAAPRYNELARLAQKLSRLPRYSEPARNLEALTGALRQRQLTEAEKHSLIEEVLKRIEIQLAAERRPGESANDLLNQAADTLRGLAQGLEKGQEGGAGAQGRKGEGDAKERGNRGEGQGSAGEQGGRGAEEMRLSSPGSSELKEGQPDRGKHREAGKKQPEKDQGAANKDGRQGEKSREVKGLGKEEQEGKGSKNMGQQIPSGKAPQRFLQPGEQGEKGIKGARFVTVQLPEEEAGLSAAEAGSGKRRELRPKIPVSNVPLRRPDSPDALPEKQLLPLAYRGLIR